MDPQLRAQPGPEAGRLAANTRLGGGRYTIGSWVRRTPYADQYEATDTTTSSPVTVHVLQPQLVSNPSIIDRLHEDLRQASAIHNKHVVRVIELAVEGAHSYVVTELVEGHSVRELLDRKRGTGSTGFGVKGATNILTHVCNALTAASEQGCHGTVTLDNVAVSRAGRVRICDFGLAALAPLGGKGLPGISPEVLAGKPPTQASDVYSTGALLYEVLVGSPPVKGCKRPSEALAGIPPAIDQVIARSMMPAPEKRFGNCTELRDAVVHALTQGSGQHAAVSGNTPVPTASGSLAAQLGARHSGQMAAAGAVSAADASPSAQMPAAAAAPAEPALPMSAALEAAMSDRQERWLISKGKLDYGPFTLAQVAEDIKADKILPGHTIVDNDTGQRVKIEDHPLLGELVDAAKERRDERRRAQAEVQHAQQEKRRGATLYIFIALGVLGLGLGAYMLVTKLSSDGGKKSAAIEGLEAGKLQAKISFPSPEEQKARSRRSGRRSGSGGAGGVAGGWDDTLNLDMEGEDGASERLSDSDVNPVIQRHGGGLGRCITSTGTRSANIEFIVMPTGKISQVRVNRQTNSPVANCVRGVMKKMQFPTFNGVRSKHYFDIGY